MATVMVTAISQRELDETYKRLAPKYQGRKEDYFTLLYLEKEFAVPEGQALQQISFYGNDYGVDGFYFDGPERKNLYLLQCKWTKDHFQFKGTLERLISQGLERIFGNLQTDQNENALLNRLRNFVFQNKNIIDQVWVRLIFNGDVSVAAGSRLLTDYLEDLQSKKYVLEEFFQRKVDLRTVFMSNTTLRLSSPQSVVAAHKYTIPNSEPLKVARSDGTARMMIHLVSLRTLLDMYLDFGEKLFERNIRSSYGFTQAQSMVNNRIKKSLIQSAIDGTQQSEDFAFFHNGVTMKASSIQENNGDIALYEPRVLNGAQTIASVNEFYQEHKAKKDILERLEQIRVVAKIVVSENESFVRNVAINNNRQNPIEPWHLRANDKIQLELEERLAMQLGIYYERRENSFANEKDADLLSRGITQDKPIKMKALGQTLLALQGQVGRMSRIGEAFETDKQYHEMFRDKYLTTDLRKLVLFYKIQNRLNKVHSAIEAMGEEKYSYVWKARYLTWAVLVQALLNDPNFDHYLQEHGADMIVQQEYGNTLQKIGTSRIRPIYSHTFRKNPYSSDLENDKFGFLRRRATFDDCMKTARKKYRWDFLNV
jgi:hypothetical protein